MHRHGSHLQPGRHKIGVYSILQNEHHLKQRRVAEVSRQSKFVHQQFEWQILMRQRFQYFRAHRLQVAAEGRFLVKVRSNRQGIDETSHQIVQRRMAAASHRRANHNVPLLAVAVQQRLKRRQQHHKWCATFALRQRFHDLPSGGGNLLIHRIPGVGHRRRSELIGRQFQQRGSAAKFFFPVAQVGLKIARRQSLLLPRRIIRIRSRQRRPRRLAVFQN